MPVQTATETLVKPAGKFSRVPLETYTVQINKVDQTPKNGAARDTLHCEILAPDSVPYLDGVVQTAGRVFEMYLVYSEKNLPYVKETLVALGIPIAPSWSVPTQAEVQQGTYTRVPEIQDITAGLTGAQFQIRLVTEQEFERAKKGDPDFDPTKAPWEQVVRKDEHGQPKYLDFHKIGMIGAKDIVSPINNMRFDAPF